MASEETAEAANTLKAFMREMNIWEIWAYDLYKPENGGPEKNAGLVKEEVKKIYDKFLTQRERKTGKLAGPSVAGLPEYDPNLEDILEVEILKPGSLIIPTRKKHPKISDFIKDYRYKILKKNDGYRIESKEVYSAFDKKWKNIVF